MRDDYYNNHRQSGGDTFFAFMTGLLLGTVAALMTNRDNRDKMRQTIDDVKQKGENLVADTAQKAEKAASEIERNAKTMAEKVQEDMDERTRNGAKRTQRQ